MCVVECSRLMVLLPETTRRAAEPRARNINVLFVFTCDTTHVATPQHKHNFD